MASQAVNRFLRVDVLVLATGRRAGAMYRRFRAYEEVCDGASGVYPSFSDYFGPQVYSNFEVVACYNLNRNVGAVKGV